MQDPLTSQPPHIAEAIAQAQAAKRKQWVIGDEPGAAPAPAAPSPPAAPQEASRAALMQREYRFEVHWKDPTGKSWDGAFLSVAPDMRTEIAVARSIAEAKGGQPDGQMPEHILELITGLAYAEHMLKPEARPVWARQIDRIPYPELAKMLIQEVIGHYATFRTGADGAAGGQA